MFASSFCYVWTFLCACFGCFMFLKCVTKSLFGHVDCVLKSCTPKKKKHHHKTDTNEERTWPSGCFLREEFSYIKYFISLTNCCKWQPRIEFVHLEKLVIYVHTLLITDISQPEFLSRWFSFSRFNVYQKSGVIVTSFWASFSWYTTIKSRWRSPLPLVLVYHGPENYSPPCWEWWSLSILSLRWCTLPETKTVRPWKMDGWNTILSYWVSAYFQVWNVRFRASKNCKVTPPPLLPQERFQVPLARQSGVRKAHLGVGLAVWQFFGCQELIVFSSPK